MPAASSKALVKPKARPRRAAASGQGDSGASSYEMVQPTVPEGQEPSLAGPKRAAAAGQGDSATSSLETVPETVPPAGLEPAAWQEFWN